MPFLKLDTNVPKSKITPEFVKMLTSVVAKTLGKPVSYVGIEVNPDQILYWGGSDEPAAFLTLMSVGQLGIELNKKHSAVIFDVVNKNLGVPGDRMYIQFTDSPPSCVGYNGSTFHPMLGNN